jgi:hypothetical protein
VPVIPAIQEIEVRRITDGGQSRQISQPHPISKHKLGMMVHTCNPSIARRVTD